MGWCISDSETGEVIKGAKKTRSPDAVVNVIMTDDGIYLVTTMQLVKRCFYDYCR